MIVLHKTHYTINYIYITFLCTNEKNFCSNLHIDCRHHVAFGMWWFFYAKISHQGRWFQCANNKSVPKPNFTKQGRRCIVCGAVQNEGYYIVPEGKTVADVVAMAGLIDETIMPENATTYIKNNCQIAVDYHQNGATFSCLNVNGATVKYNLPAENISADIIQKLHTYLTNYGKITNKQVLKRILTAEEYEQNHYKFFVTEDDYEANS